LFYYYSIKDYANYKMAIGQYLAIVFIISTYFEMATPSVSICAKYSNANYLSNSADVNNLSIFYIKI